ncbi:flagellar type III secretion system pore protein FliP [Xanthomonas sp. NCPPB 2654]|uniref:flagellar type III secretion system pore protein FliP n=1 Tax=unclassified Xanthomonas TaxID=2643310 RepID=UPI0021E0B632|nr:MULTISPECIES: flagellar type III secretion system pore protein FliP [unclassified Xanthomonas]MDL5366701.1 flagellar type III secretion system pore protein FliP [Xanthomonas sp. NCPPB 2654]MDR6673047.1 flagellar biosynthetic protein FliP [Xanthomonas translucens]MEB1527956.1 flagellar type III secretion system pore protein FliP [Xanthomonas campestris pv. campestris]UYC22658.1 flagellar type III secretion system pore protein FliP [Xanthomonas sp. CFBP 8443]
MLLRWNRYARGLRLLLILLTLSLLPALGWAQAAPAAAPATPAPAAQNAAPTLPSLPQVNVGKVGAQPVSLPLQTLLLMTAITLLPSMLLVLTAFTRITIVLGLLRQAMGTGQTPSNQVLMGLALFLTALVMMPVWEKAWGQGMSPYLNGQIDFQTAWTLTTQPLRAFMLAQVREADLMTFAGMAGNGTYSGPDAIPFPVLVASFVTSELKTAFEIGFLIFIPFVIIDLVVASVLMSMGMMMMSPMLVSAPFKILLFVLVDGWVLTVGTLAASFNGV